MTVFTEWQLSQVVKITDNVEGLKTANIPNTSPALQSIILVKFKDFFKAYKSV